ncbi:hypothetical protein L1049_004901 [Liquidambar formosana]|uniref:Uncharacterized protein n=1 Tax=Liquidambar formosana TaxID=63359 RepID=A0AAP0RU62_LIQFO
MSDSPRHPHPCFKEETPQHEEEEEQNTRSHQRLCDFCGDLTALLYCRADSARLCFACDREVHSTNQLFTKHTRSQLCDACDASPASILCSTEALVLCQNCDWERHNRSVSSIHDRRPLEGFTGCPPVFELCSIVGAEDMGNKGLFGSDESGGDCLGGSGVYGFSDYFVWETPTVGSFDDLIGSMDSSHGFQAIGVPPLPKNRNTACGRHKEEILRQLRELAKLEPDLNYDHEDVEPFVGFQPLVPEQFLKPRNMYTDCEHDAEPFVVTSSHEASAFQWCSDSGEATNQVFLPSTLLGSNREDSCLVPDKPSDIGSGVSHANGDHERKSQHLMITETSPVFPKVASHEFNSQERDTALSRYKEKKKTRRYDKHIRYESRKARAESRTRIKGRFAKIDH